MKTDVFPIRINRKLRNKNRLEENRIFNLWTKYQFLFINETHLRGFLIKSEIILSSMLYRISVNFECTGPPFFAAGMCGGAVMQV